MKTPVTVQLTPARSSLDSREHIPALDGLRGLAIVFVLVMHFGIMTPLTGLDRFVYGVARNGWIGVDLFFVLSGFLITGILLDSRGRERALRTFFARRFLRIFPLYYGLLIAVFVVCPLFFAGAAWLEKLEGQQLYHWFYLSNVLASRVGWTEIPYIGHLWSLAIEEQFYLVWPFLALFLSPRRLLGVCGGMIAISMTARVAMVLDGVYPVAMYAQTFARWDGLAVGAMIAIAGRQAGWMERLSRWSGPVFVAGSLASIGILASEPYRSHYGVATQTVGYPIIALTFGALLVRVLNTAGDASLNRVLSSSRLRFMGRYSYGIYVLHGPVVGVLAAIGLSPAIVPALWGSAIPGQVVYALIALVATLAAALASWTLLERPFLGLKRYFPSPGAGPAVVRPDPSSERVVGAQAAA